MEGGWERSEGSVMRRIEQGWIVQMAVIECCRTCSTCCTAAGEKDSSYIPEIVYEYMPVNDTSDCSSSP